MMFSSDERIAIEELAHDYCALAEAGEVGALVGLFSEDAKDRKMNPCVF